MLETRTERAIAVVVLLGALVALALRFGTVQPNPRLGYFPTGDHLAVAYDGYVGERVQVSGTVARVDPVVLTVDYAGWVDGRYRTGTSRLRVVGLDRPVAEGQALQVYGVVRPDRTIRAAASVVAPVGNQVYMYVVSFLAGLWVLARLVRGWTVAWDEFALRRRPRPVPVAEAVAERLRTGGSDDA